MAFQRVKLKNIHHSVLRQPLVARNFPQLGTERGVNFSEARLTGGRFLFAKFSKKQRPPPRGLINLNDISIFLASRSNERNDLVGAPGNICLFEQSIKQSANYTYNSYTTSVLLEFAVDEVNMRCVLRNFN